jgi:hypothetical protein
MNTPLNTPLKIIIPVVDTNHDDDFYDVSMEEEYYKYKLRPRDGASSIWKGSIGSNPDSNETNARPPDAILKSRQLIKESDKTSHRLF